jgi:hypothetical protein
MTENPHLWKVVPKFLDFHSKLNPDFPGYVPPTKTPRNPPPVVRPTVSKSAPVATSEAQEHSSRSAEPPYVNLEPPPPLSAFNDDPLFKTRDAAVILGVTGDCLKKWRQRGAGPTYIQYPPDHGNAGAVRYSLGMLRQFLENYTVRTRQKKQK